MSPCLLTKRAGHVILLKMEDAEKLNEHANLLVVVGEIERNAKTLRNYDFSPVFLESAKKLKGNVFLTEEEKEVVGLELSKVGARVKAKIDQVWMAHLLEEAKYVSIYVGFSHSPMFIQTEDCFARGFILTDEQKAIVLEEHAELFKSCADMTNRKAQ